ncbi:MAG: hypothetical protein ACRDJE_07300 [Dehalococcoidia bacterium]
MNDADVTMEIHQSGHLLIRGAIPEDVQAAVDALSNEPMHLCVSQIEWDVRDGSWKVGVFFLPASLARAGNEEIITLGE